MVAPWWYHELMKEPLSVFDYLYNIYDGTLNGGKIDLHEIQNNNYDRIIK